jgi:glucosyl-3-phosphoglycerate synthase
MVFLDADIDGDLANAARSLATPVMADASCHFVKGYFVRERLPGVDPELAGGRVTELVARPLIASVAPWLGFVHEPLSGQVAMSRRFAQQMRVVTGYGLEIGMLFDAVLTLGTDGVAEVDIGTIRNPPKPGDHLTRMGDEVASTLLRRVAAFHRDPGFADTVSHLVVAELPERPPLHTVTP